MKKTIIATIAASLMLISTPSYAGKLANLTKDLQFGAGIGFLDLGLTDSALLFYGIAEKEVDVKLGETTNTVQVRLGTSTTATSNSPFSTLTYETSLNYLISGLFKSTLDLEDGISAYGMLGFSFASIDFVVPSIILGSNFSTTVTDSGVSYGFGADYKVDNDLTIAAEYTSYLSNADAFAVNAYFSF